MYRIYWKSTLTKVCGHGNIMEYKNAKHWADKGNKDYPMINHWVVNEE